MLEVELKIEDKKINVIERFQDIIEKSYDNNENAGDYSIYNRAMLNLQRVNFGDDHLVDDEDDDVICLHLVYEILHEKLTKRKISV